LNYRVSNEVGDTSKALARIEQAQKNSNNNALNILLAQAYFSDKQYTQAIQFLENLNKNEYQLDANYWFTLANSYLANSQAKKAIATYANWGQIAPNNETIWLRKIELEEDELLFNDALSTVKSALLRLPESTRLRLVEANLLASFNRTTEAQTSLNKLNDEALDIPFAKKVQGHIYALKGNYQQALPMLLEGYESAPALRNAGLVFVTHKALGQIDDAFSFLEKHIAEFPNDLNSRLLIANEYLAVALSKAKVHYAKAVELNPNHAIALNNLAYLHQKDGEFTQADKFASLAIKEAPDNPQLLDTAGSIKIDLGDKEAALALLERAARLAPKDETVKANLQRARDL
jgi:tetratricopeptide (TPR) repeat protein